MAWEWRPGRILAQTRRSSRRFTAQRPLLPVEVANPLALLLAAALMLEHVGRGELAQRLRSAISSTLQEDKIRTRDLGGTSSTKDLLWPFLKGF